MTLLVDAYIANDPHLFSEIQATIVKFQKMGGDQGIFMSGKLTINHLGELEQADKDVVTQHIVNVSKSHLKNPQVLDKCKQALEVMGEDWAKLVDISIQNIAIDAQSVLDNHAEYKSSKLLNLIDKSLENDKSLSAFSRVILGNGLSKEEGIILNHLKEDIANIDKVSASEFEKQMQMKVFKVYLDACVTGGNLKNMVEKMIKNYGATTGKLDVFVGKGADAKNIESDILKKVARSSPELGAMICDKAIMDGIIHGKKDVFVNAVNVVMKMGGDAMKAFDQRFIAMTSVQPIALGYAKSSGSIEKLFDELSAPATKAAVMKIMSGSSPSGVASRKKASDYSSSSAFLVSAANLKINTNLEPTKPEQTTPKIEVDNAPPLLSQTTPRSSIAVTEPNTPTAADSEPTTPRRSM